MTQQAQILGQRIRQRRVQLGLTQRRLAEHVGIRFTHVSRVERGDSGVSLEVLARFSDALKVSMEWLLEGNQSQLPPPRVLDGELTDDESSAVGCYRRLSRADQRFMMRVMAALQDDVTAEKNGANAAQATSQCWHALGDEYEGVATQVLGNGNTSQRWLQQPARTITLSDDGLQDLKLRTGDLVVVDESVPVASGLPIAVIVDEVHVYCRVFSGSQDGMMTLRSTSLNERTMMIESTRVRILGVITHVWR